MLDADEFQTAPRILPETGRTPASGCRDRQEGRLCVFVADSVLDGFSAFARIPQHIILLERQGEFRIGTKGGHGGDSGDRRGGGTLQPRRFAGGGVWYHPYRLPTQ